MYLLAFFAVFALLLGLLPLLWIPGLHQQFELPKFLYILVLGAVVCIWSGVRLFQGKRWNTLPRPLFWLGFLWLIYLVVHSLGVSEVPDLSLWGSYQRHTGLLLWLVLMGIFFFMASYPWSAERRRRMLFMVALSGTMVSLLAVGQGLWHMGTGALLEVSGRVYGTFGIPNFLGQWILLAVPLPLYFLLHSQGRERIFWFTSVLLHVLTLLWTQNRASILLFFAAILLLSFLFLVRKRAFRPLLAGGLVLLTLLVTAAILRPEGALRTIVTRSYLYPMGVEAMLDAPWFGHGLDTGYAVFGRYVPADLAEVEQLGFVPDKLHQTLLDMLVEVGVVGTVLFLSLLGTLLIMVMRRLPSLHGEERGLTSLLLSGLLLWMLSLLVSFPGVAERTLATVFLALLVGLSCSRPVGPSPSLRFLAPLPLVLSPLLLVLAVATFQADWAFARLPTSVRPQDFPEILRRTPLNLEYAVFGANGHMPSVTTEARAVALAYALQRQPEDPWALVFLADVRRLQGDMASMRSLLGQAEKSCPRCAFVFLAGARLEYFHGDEQRARVWAEKYWSLLPDFVTGSGVTVPEHWGDRRRIILKEQNADIAFISALLGRLLPLSGEKSTE